MNVSIYYHIWACPDVNLCKLMVDEQLKKIYRSGILDKATFYCCINGENASDISNFVSLYNWVKVLEVNNSDDQYEGFTLKHLYEECIFKDVKVLYFHTKGLSHLCGSRKDYEDLEIVYDQFSFDKRFRAVNSWRHFLEWGAINNWKKCLDKLENYDVSGVNYMTTPWPHMSGNFWWSKSEYIRKLIHPTEHEFSYDDKDFGPIFYSENRNFDPLERMNFEKWVGMENPNVFSLHNIPSNVNIYWDDIESYYNRANKFSSKDFI